MVLPIASSWSIPTGWSGRALLPRCMVRISWFLFCMLDHTDQVFGFPSKNRIHYVMMFNKLTLNKWMLYECPFFSFFLLLLQETSGFRAGDSIACGYCQWRCPMLLLFCLSITRQSCESIIAAILKLGSSKRKTPSWWHVISIAFADSLCISYFEQCSSNMIFKPVEIVIAFFAATMLLLILLKISCYRCTRVRTLMPDP